MRPQSFGLSLGLPSFASFIESAVTVRVPESEDPATVVDLGELDGEATLDRRRVMCLVPGERGLLERGLLFPAELGEPPTEPRLALAALSGSLRCPSLGWPGS